MHGKDKTFVCYIRCLVSERSRYFCLIIISVTASEVVKYRIFTGSEDLSRRGLLGAFPEIYRVEKESSIPRRTTWWEAGREGGITRELSNITY